MQVRHQTLKGEPLHTRYGVVQLDEHGMVTNLKELSGTPEQLISHVPGFLDASIYPPKTGPGTPIVPKNPAPSQQDPTETVREGTDEEYATIIKELVDGGAKLNSDGHIEMDVLNQELRRRGLKIITGTKRKELSHHDESKDQGLPTEE